MNRFRGYRLRELYEIFLQPNEKIERSYRALFILFIYFFSLSFLRYIEIWPSVRFFRENIILRCFYFDPKEKSFSFFIVLSSQNRWKSRKLCFIGHSGWKPQTAIRPPRTLKSETRQLNFPCENINSSMNILHLLKHEPWTNHSCAFDVFDRIPVK